MHQNKNQKHKQKIHFPVLLDSVLKVLDPKPGQSYLDVTAGYGGHAAAILERTLHPENAVLVDRDQMAIDHLENVFLGSGVQIMHTDFLSAAQELFSQERTFDLVLLDLGVSSPHLNTASRGFSFRLDAPLDMRMDQRQELTADMVVNQFSAEELARILQIYGEEPKAQRLYFCLCKKFDFFSQR